jgi:hypothetical protein
MVANEIFDFHFARTLTQVFLIFLVHTKMSQIFGQARGGGGNLFLGGSKISDQDIRDQNGTSQISRL